MTFRYLKRIGNGDHVTNLRKLYGDAEERPAK